MKRFDSPCFCAALLPALAAALALAPRPALGQDAVTGVDITVHATFLNVGIQVTVSGDDNGNARALLEVSVGGGGFAPGHELSRVDASRFVGSAFMIEPDTDFGVRVTLEDADGVTSGVLEASGRTRSKTIPAASGRIIHVSTSGDDGASGDESSPLRTLGRAVQAAAAGDTILIHGGEYHEEVDVTAGGSAGNPLVIRAAGDGPAVLTGFDPALSDPAAWTDEGSGVYSAAAPETRYAAAGGVRLWMYETLDDLRALTLGLDGGFAYDGGRVYVRLPGGASPSEVAVMVSTLGRALWIEGAPHVVVDGLVIRGYGAEEYSQGIMVRDGSHGVWIVNSIFENCMPGIWVKNDVDDLAVLDNEFSDMGLAGFPWDAVKARGGMESGGIAIDGQYDGQGIVFEGNIVHDTFDGLGICGGQAMAHPNNADVIGNHVYHCGDDGMETDGECSNIRIIGNRFEDCLCGVSVAPALGGPTWVIRNLMVNLRNVAPGSDWMTRSLKFNVGDDRPSGEIFIYHNTGVTFETGQNAFAVTDDSRWTRVLMLNNIWMGTEYGFYYSNSGDEPFHHDYDILHTTDASRLVTYQGDRYGTVPEYFAGTGQCEHCLAADPLFADAAGGDYTLQEASPAVDSAAAVAGVNEAFSGDGPDRGALERGGGVIPVPDAPPETPADTGPDVSIPDATTDTSTDAGGDTDGNGGGSSGCGCTLIAR